MRVYYDLHIHSALSPCGDEDMTPNNIVNMALLKGLDVIAVTDHNSCGNVRAVMGAADGRLLVVPGMEAETAEEIHVLCYFPAIEAAEEMEAVLRAHRLPIQNRPDIYGRQLYMNAKDEVTGEEAGLLVTATTLDLYALTEAVRKLGGVPVPAHIDRESYSVLASLGAIPEELNFTALEITEKHAEQMGKDYPNQRILTSSDAHYLWDMAEAERFLDISDKNVPGILDKLTKINS